MQAMAEHGTGTEHEESFGEKLGEITLERVRSRVKRAKRIIDESNFDGCSVAHMRSVWEAVLEVLDIMAAAFFALAERPKNQRPRTLIEFAWSMLDRSPMALAVSFLAVCILKASGHDVGDLFGLIEAHPTP